MKIIYMVIAVICGAVAWICTQTVWEYQFILEYIAFFLTSFFVCLIFVYQEENEISKKYNILTPSNLIYIVIVAALLIVFSKYDYSAWRENTGSFWRVVFTVNACQGVFLMIFYKIRDWYNHM